MRSSHLRELTHYIPYHTITSYITITSYHIPSFLSTLYVVCKLNVKFILPVRDDNSVAFVKFMILFYSSLSLDFWHASNQCVLVCRGYAAKKREVAFRKWFSRINDIHSIVRKVPVIALTATATTATRLQIIRALEMKNPALVVDIPNRQNITYGVKVITPNPAATFQKMVSDLKDQKNLYERTIVYGPTIKLTTNLYGFFQAELGTCNNMWRIGSLHMTSVLAPIISTRVIFKQAIECHKKHLAIPGTKWKKYVQRFKDVHANNYCQLINQQ